MKSYVAFLRGMNLGNRRLKMEKLRALFEELRLENVATFIASGNVLFESKQADDAKLSRLISQHLEKSLGYEVEVFVRTHAEVGAIAAYLPFPAKELEVPTNTVHVGLVNKAFAPECARGLQECRTEIDEFHVNGREYYWLCRIRTHESKVWSSPKLKALKLPSSTMRNMTTMRKLAAVINAKKS